MTILSSLYTPVLSDHLLFLKPTTYFYPPTSLDTLLSLPLSLENSFPPVHLMKSSFKASVKCPILSEVFPYFLTGFILCVSQPLHHYILLICYLLISHNCFEDKDPCLLLMVTADIH